MRHFYDLGLRQRTLTLPVVLALVLSMIWRQIGSVRSAVLLLEREGFLWTGPVRASHQALNQRLRSLPAGLFRQVLFDLGSTSFARFAQLTAARVTFVTRAKGNLAYQVDRALRRASAVHDEVIWVGGGADRQRLRLISVLHRGRWQRYLTNELDPEVLPVLYAVPLYYQRWRIEDAYALVKRLLGLAYFWSGAENAVQLQRYATWNLYAVLLDLGDAVAAALDLPLAAISLDRLYRHLYFFTVAYMAGTATDVLAYMAAKARPLGILKERRARPPAPTIFQQLALTLAQNP